MEACTQELGQKLFLEVAEYCRPAVPGSTQEAVRRITWVHLLKTSLSNTEKSHS